MADAEILAEVEPEGERALAVVAARLLAAPSGQRRLARLGRRILLDGLLLGHRCLKI